MGAVYKCAAQYLDQLGPGKFIEIGTSRNGDDGSTRVLSEWATQYGRQLTTIDMDPDNCNLVTSWALPNTTVVNSTGEQFLQDFPKHTDYISLLYLDNFDWDWHPQNTPDFIRNQQSRYAELGLTMNNVNSQAAHLQQMCYALPAMSPKSIVICDDTWYNKWWGHYSGKSGAVIPLLLNNGFTVAYTEEQPVYGTILTRGII
jgi:hypothetical protein